jgi:hypothetical protein
VDAAKAARSKKRDAEGRTAQDKTKPAENDLRKAARKMLSFLRRLKSLRARKSIPAETRQSFLDEATPIQVDLKTLLGTL